MCKHNTLSYILLDGKLKALDRCIASFVLQLNLAGIKTKNSCCGHGMREPCVVCEPGTEDKLRKFGCTRIKTRQRDRYVFAYFPANSESGLVYIEEST